MSDEVILEILAELNARDARRGTDAAAREKAAYAQIEQINAHVGRVESVLGERLGRLESAQELVGEAVADAMAESADRAFSGWERRSLAPLEAKVEELQAEIGRCEEERRQMRRTCWAVCGAALITALVCAAAAWMTFHGIANDIQAAYDAVNQANALAQQVYDKLGEAYEPVATKPALSVIGDIFDSLTAIVTVVGTLVVGAFVALKIFSK